MMPSPPFFDLIQIILSYFIHWFHFINSSGNNFDFIQFSYYNFSHLFYSLFYLIWFILIIISFHPFIWLDNFVFFMLSCLTCLTASLPSSSFSGTPCTKGSRTEIKKNCFRYRFLKRHVQIWCKILFQISQKVSLDPISIWRFIDPTPTTRNAAEIAIVDRCHS